MLDFSHVLSTPGADIQTFFGHVSTALRQWHTWRKPRGAKFIYMIGVGGGGSGGTGIGTGTTSGGGGGGGSGGQTIVMIPAFLVPDVLYINAGIGGASINTFNTAGQAGGQTSICIEPNTAVLSNITLLAASGGSGGLAGTANLGGAAGAGGTVVTIGSMPLAARGFYNFLAGQAGIAGTAPNGAVSNLTEPVTGLMVTGGAGGGATYGSTSTTVGGAINTATTTLAIDFFTFVPGVAAAVT